MRTTEQSEYDAIVIGSGPNGLSAAITLQREGLSVLVLEGKPTIGGGLRTQELTLPGYLHDVCSAIHPLAFGSPFFRTLPLKDFGLQFVQPDIPAAHPFDDGNAAVLYRSMEDTAALLKHDENRYTSLLKPLVKDWRSVDKDILAPLKVPSHPWSLAKFGFQALKSATHFAKQFSSKEAKGLWAGMAAHSLQPLTNFTTAAIGLVLLATGHVHGWPIPKEGSQSIASALAAYFVSLGGKIETNAYVQSLKQLPSSKAILFDTSPHQLLQIAGQKLSRVYRWQLKRYRYGMGVFKVDWALKEPIPFKAEACRRAGTVHIGNTFEEIAHSEHLASKGVHSDKPFVLLAQQSLFDKSRAPEGKHTAWAYCHVPNGSTVDMTVAIESQVERFAPGFKDIILAKSVKDTKALEMYNPNYVGGDINNGVLDIYQLFTRPALRYSPYRSSAKGLYICSSATPPGGGVHGMCGYYAAARALKDIFKITAKPLS